MRFLDTLLSILFPVRCALCRTAGYDLCADCLASWPPAERESAEWIFPLYDYRHPGVKKVLWLFKYSGKSRLAGPLGEALCEVLFEELADRALLENFREPLLIPVPLSPARFRERGYNQAERLARAIAVTCAARGGPALAVASDVLQKPRDTEHQARLRDRRKRLENLRGTFAVSDPLRVRGRNVILVDDILTTGATLSEARTVLRNAGARRIIALTVAH